MSDSISPFITGELDKQEQGLCGREKIFGGIEKGGHHV